MLGESGPLGAVPTNHGVTSGPLEVDYSHLERVGGWSPFDKDLTMRPGSKISAMMHVSCIASAYLISHENWFHLRYFGN